MQKVELSGLRVAKVSKMGFEFTAHQVRDDIEFVGPEEL